MELLTFAPLFVVVAFFLWIWDLDKSNNTNRFAVFAFTMAASIWYLVWRTDATLFAVDWEGTFQNYWFVAVYAVEILAFVEVSIFLLIMSKTINRSQEADLYEKIRYNPAVDVFIPTYNEPVEVLEKTIVGAKHIDYSNKTVWVLDDGRRDWLKNLCDHYGVNYLTRDDNSHAKAGNINNGLVHASGEYICIFDADFVPHRNFIKRTIGFFTDDTIGIVQTPQHFYNKDPIQTNLSIANEYPDEQRLFFDEMAVCRDAWDAAFCCGSCSIIRRSALDKVGGVPTESVTEDLLTTLVLLRKGFKTIYLNEKLSVGLAAESITSYFVQRQRWARGAIQSLFLKSGPLGKGLTLAQRVLFLPVSWIVQYPVRLMILVIPVVYLLTGTLPIAFTDVTDFVFYQVTIIVAYLLSMQWLVGKKYFPLLSTSINVFAIFKLLPTIAHSLVKPFGEGFRVTPKGTNVSYLKFDMLTFSFIMVFSILTLIGIFINVIPEMARVEHDNFFPVAAGWAIVNMIMMTLAGMLCFEKPKDRAEERFFINEDASVTIDSITYCTILKDLSLSGAKIYVKELDMLPKSMLLYIHDVGSVEFNPIRHVGRNIVGTFNLDENAKELVIAKLFSGKYNNNVASVDGKNLFSRLRNRLFN